MIPGSANPLLLTSADSGYEIKRSLRFNSGDSSYLDRTPSAAGNRKTWTWSGWVKRSVLGTQKLFIAGVSGTEGGVQFHSGTDNTGISLYDYQNGAHTFQLNTTQLFRDVASWYHIVAAIDTTQSTASDRVKLYINGEQVTSFATANYPTQSLETLVNNNNAHHLGFVSGHTSYFNGYLADVHFIDGQQLAATDFGETDDNGVWQPKKFAGVYSDTFSSEMASISSGNVFPANGTSTINALDGSTSTALDCRRGTHSGTTSIRFTPSSAIANVTKIRVWSNFANKYEINGGGYNTFTSNGSWAEIYNGSAISLSELTVIRDSGNAGADYGHQLHAIEINDVILTRSGGNNSFYLDFADNSSNAALGTDTSGNSNTWTVNNLNAAINSSSYSIESGSYLANLTTTNTANNYSELGTRDWNIKSFDGNLSTSMQISTGGGTTTATWTPSSAVAITSGFRFHMGGSWNIGGTTYEISYNVNGTGWTTIGSTSDSNSAGSTAAWRTVTVPGNSLTSFAVRTISGSGSWGSGAWKALEVNGTVLIENGLATDLDSLVDTPTNGTASTGGDLGGVTVGNYATMNPLTSSASATFSNGNLDFACSAQAGGFSTIGVTSGKWYFEVTAGSLAVNTFIGVFENPENVFQGYFEYQLNGGTFFTNVGGSGTYTSGAVEGDVVGIAVDIDNGTLQVFKNGTSLGTATGGSLSGKTWFPGIFSNAAVSNAYSINFGQRAFNTAAPTNFKALNTASLPTPTIADGSKYFDTKLWTGTGVSRSVTGYNFSPDFAWIKSRSAAQGHGLFDQLRLPSGSYGYPKLKSHSTDEEKTVGYWLTSFNSDGFTVNGGDTNGNNDTYAGFAWDAGSSNTTIAASSLNSSLYDQSQHWSTYGTFTGTVHNDYDWSGVFSASDWYGADGSMYLSSGTGKWTLTSSIACSSGVKFYVWGNLSITINEGLSDEITQTSTGGNAFHYFTIPFSGNIASIKVNTATVYLLRIFVDGAALIDAGITLGSGDVPNVPSIASTVRANPSAGFSIVSYTGNGVVGDHDIAHGLNATPGFVIIKNRTTGQTYPQWTIKHKDLTSNKNILFTTGAEITAIGSGGWYQGGIRDLTSSTTFGIGNGSQNLNRNVNYPSADYIAYCFAPVEGYSAMGSYTGNGVDDGPFVYTGFKVAWLMVKNTTTSGETWTIYDAARDPHNLATNRLQPNASDAETSGTVARDKDFLSNGFKVRGSSGEQNTSGDNYVYLAFASNPFASNGGLAR